MRRLLLPVTTLLLLSFAPVGAQGTPGGAPGMGMGGFGPHPNSPGCMGSNGIPDLCAAPIPGNVPTIGQTFILVINNLPLQSGGVYIVLGFRKDIWLGQTLPFDLGALGLWGCTLYQDIVFVFPWSHPGQATTFPLDIPPFTFLLGTHFCLQALVMDQQVARPSKHSVTGGYFGIIGC